MDPTAITSSSPATTSPPDTENEVPPDATAQPNNNKCLSLITNGSLKKHSPHQHQQYHHPQPLAAVVVYKECLRNHAAAMGGHALDGCGEFMPSPAANPTDPTSLKCAACGCHRNFHRHEDDPVSTHFLEYPRQLLTLPAPPPRRGSPLSSPSPPPPQTQQQQQLSYFSSAPHMLLALSSAAPEGHYPAVATPATPTAGKAENPSGRKRFRTRFSQEQKEKMLSFSERMGWKMQRGDEAAVEDLCTEIGVSKSVLKVWMHNNKHTFCKRDINSAINNSNSSGTKVVNFDNNGHNGSNINGVHDLRASTNGDVSPSSA